MWPLPGGQPRGRACESRAMRARARKLTREQQHVQQGRFVHQHHRRPRTPSPSAPRSTTLPTSAMAHAKQPSRGAKASSAPASSRPRRERRAPRAMSPSDEAAKPQLQSRRGAAKARQHNNRAATARHARATPAAPTRSRKKKTPAAAPTRTRALSFSLSLCVSLAFCLSLARAQSLAISPAGARTCSNRRGGRGGLRR